MGTVMKSQEVENIKLLLSKGLSKKEICQITGRSDKTISRVKKGCYDEPAKTDSRFDELSDLMKQHLELLIRIDEVLKSLKEDKL